MKKQIPIRKKKYQERIYFSMKEKAYLMMYLASLFTEEEAEPRSKKARGVTRSFSKEALLDVVLSINQALLLMFESGSVFLELVEAVLLTQRSNAQ